MKISVFSSPCNTGVSHEIEGITLRDLFAMAALGTAMLQTTHAGCHTAATNAYDMADSMIAAREKAAK